MARLGMVFHHGIEGGAELARRARLAEERGYDSLWVTERYFQEETFSLLGYLAAATERIELGVGVVNPYTRHPGLVAMAAATVDRLAGGRLLLGLGRSDRGVIEQTFGIPYDAPRETLAEAVSVIRRLLAGETVDDPGGAARATGREARRHPHTPAADLRRRDWPARAASRGRGRRRRAAQRLHPHGLHPVRGGRGPCGRRGGRTGSGRSRHRLHARRAAHRGPASILPQLRGRLAGIMAEPHVGELMVERGGVDLGDLDALRAADASGDRDAGGRLVSDDVAEACTLVGNAGRIRERIEEYRDAGVDRPLLLPRLPDFERVAEALAP